MHQTMIDYLKSLEASGRNGSAPSYELCLRQFSGWLESQALDALSVTAEKLDSYQYWLGNEYKKEDGSALKKSTQLTRLIPVCSYYRWLARQGVILSNPAAKVKLPSVRRRETPKDYLDLQEATALIQTQARRVLKGKEGSFKWSEHQRNLALVCLAIATGRRRQGLLGLHVSDLDLERCELRVEWEKGRPGRVLPVAKWAIDVCRIYLEAARKRLLGKREDKGWLFPGTINERVAGFSFYGFILALHAASIEENPDLESFGAKRLTPHCLRVSFATLLFKGGCNIRSINELMLHRCLNTTARYTPIPLEDLRRACRLGHPRA